MRVQLCMGARKLAFVGVVAVLAALAPIVGAGAAPTFTRNTIASQLEMGEPRTFTDPTAPGAKFFIVGNGAGIGMWWSYDGIHYSGPANTNQGGGDGDLAIDNLHRVFASDLVDNNGNSTIPVSMWNPSTHRFTLRGYVDRNASNPETGGYDRQWMASPSTNTLTMIAANGSELAWVSTDSGAHWSVPVTVDTDVDVAGPLVKGPSVNGVAPLYFSYLKFVTDPSDPTGQTGSENLLLAKTTDGGRHWAKYTIAKNQSAVLFPVVAVDSGGNGVYAAWSGDDAASQNSEVIVFSRSVDAGRTWTKPVAVSDNRVDPIGDAPAAVFPWINAGSPGRVDITYAIQKQPLLNSPVIGSDFGTQESTWDLRAAQSLNATATKPSWSISNIAPNFHTGSICSFGLACVNEFYLVNLGLPFDRRDLDYFGAALDGYGRLYIPFCGDRSPTSGSPDDLLRSDIDLRQGRQLGGSPVGAPPH